MKFNNTPFEFESIYRPLYELRISFVWAVCGILSFSNIGFLSSMSYRMLLLQSSVSFMMSAFFFVRGYDVMKMQNRLYGAPFKFISLKEFAVGILESPSAVL